MPVQSRWTIPVPQVSLQKWVFGSSFDALPDFKAFLDADQPDSRYLAFSDFRLLSKRVALGLQNAGLLPGDRVLLYAGNNIYFPAIIMGIIMAGGIFTGASPAFGAAELAYQLRDSGAKFALAQKSVGPVAVQAASQAGLAVDHLYSFDDSLPAGTGGNSNDLKHWSELLAGAAEAQRFDWVEPADPRETTCCLNYSSGTTGLPKGVEITHHAYVANGEATLHFELEKYPPQAQSRTGICFMPMYHAAGQTMFTVNYPKMRVSTYVMPSYNLEKLLSYVERFKITTFAVAPPVVLQLAKSPLVAKYDLSSVRELVCGTAPLSVEMAREAEQRLWPKGDSFIRQGWGMTELTCSGALWSHDDKMKTASVGEIVPNATFRLLEGDKEITEHNKPGELWFTGPTVMKGYWRNPNATAETIVEENGVRWVKTGDIAYVDKYGPGAKIYIVDRLKELIKVRGFQVSPSELEGALLDRADIVDAGVVGVVVEGEEVPRAYAVRNSDVTEQEIIQWIKGRVAHYKQLRGGVAFSGKILRRRLREMAKQERASPKAKLA
ncbi:hypothetical protein ACJ41O_000031 [Fusarium nematophilum]